MSEAIERGVARYTRTNYADKSEPAVLDHILVYIRYVDYRTVIPNRSTH